MSLSNIEQIYEGGDKIFLIPFSYIKKDDIKVYINGNLTSSYSFNNAQTIVINDSLEVGDKVFIERVTDNTNNVTEFSNLSLLKNTNLNIQAKQLLYLIQELQDKNIVHTSNLESLQSALASLTSVVALLTSHADGLDVSIDEVLESIDTLTDTLNAAQEAILNAQNAANKAQQAANTVEETLTSKANNDLSNLTQEGIDLIKQLGGSGGGSGGSTGSIELVVWSYD